MSMVTHVIYLHGFASSPASSKAQRFEQELARHGVGFSCPDFNEPSFETLTITRMLDQTAKAIEAAGSGQVALVGSSLGAFVAVHAAVSADQARVSRLVLLAPALDFGGNLLRHFGVHGMEEWRSRGKISFFHHAFNEPREIGFQLYEDAARYDAFSVMLAQPSLIFQGRQDESVDPDMVERWASGRHNVDLRLVHDGHQLTASMDEIWKETERFLALV